MLSFLDFIRGCRSVTNLLIFSSKIVPVGEKTIDLHGYNLEDANNKIKDFIKKSYIEGVNKIIIITGKGSRSKNTNNPYQSFDLSILKYSVPNYIKKNFDLMKFIKKINYDAINSPNQGSFDIFLKKKL